MYCAYIDVVDKQDKQLNFFSSLLLAVIRTFIDRIIKRLQHFKRSLDAGLSRRLLFSIIFLLLSHKMFACYSRANQISA